MVLQWLFEVNCAALTCLMYQHYTKDISVPHMVLPGSQLVLQLLFFPMKGAGDVERAAEANLEVHKGFRRISLPAFSPYFIS